MFRAFVLTLCLLVFMFCSHAQPKRFSYTRPEMGSPFTIIFYAYDAGLAAQTADASFLLVDSLVNILSDYTDSSELNKLCAAAGKDTVACSPTLFDILLQAQYAYVKSKGSFDITLGPLTRLWRKARREKKFPEHASVKRLLALTGCQKLSLDTITHQAYLAQPGMQLDLGGIGQGYIAQQVINYLRQQGITDALVDVSGDIVSIGKPPGTMGWTIAVNLPESEHDVLSKQLLISNVSVTTSGDVYQYLEHGGKRYSHIVNPATGYGITSQRNVTVIAGDGTTADWLTKACSILSIPRAIRLANSLQAELLIAELKNGKLVLHASKGFERYWK